MLATNISVYRQLQPPSSLVFIQLLPSNPCTKYFTPRLMAQSVASSELSPLQCVAPVLRPQPGEETVSALPHAVRRIVCVSLCATDLKEGKTWLGRELE